jgi:tetratricopeptide (TPR) repeat protein
VAVPDRLLDQIGPAAAGDPAWDAAAAAINAQYVISAVLREQGEHYYLQAEIRRLDTGKSFRFEVDAGNTALDQIVLESAERIAKGLDVELGETSRPGVRQLSDLAEYESALRFMQKGAWLAAIAQLESTLDADPLLFEAWYRLALARSWGGVAPALAARAAKEAERLSTSAHDAQLMRGLYQYLRGDFTAALATLRPLHDAHPGDRDVLYHLAEAVYHDGNHRQGVELFDKLLEHSPHFLMAAWHPFQRSLIDRDELKARRYRAIVRPGNTKQDLDLAFALGEYEHLAAGPPGKHKLHSQVVLRREQEVDTFFTQSQAHEPMAIINKLAWALSQDDKKLAVSLFDSYWKLLDSGDKTAANDYLLLQLGEVLVTGGLADQTKTLLVHWQNDPEMDGSLVYQELSIHSAPLLNDPALTQVNLRNTGLARKASAIQAELAGDAAMAEELWRQSLADPYHYNSYLDRAAQIRILQAKGKSVVLNAACAELERPAVYRPALMTSRCAPGVVADKSQLSTTARVSHGGPTLGSQRLAEAWR